MMVTEWLVISDSTASQAILGEKASPRKLRLMMVAHFRRCWESLPNENCKLAVGTLERFADDLASIEELLASRCQVLDWGELVRLQNFEGCAWAREVADWLRVPLPQSIKVPVADIPEVFGNPFRPVALDPAWLTSTAVAIAQGIYDDRAFDRMPILADALQDAGCENADILAHCRGEGPHVRGCWVVDLVLGKT